MAFVINRRTFLAAAALAPATRLAVAADNPVRIGYSMCLTGLFAQAAPSQVNAYELWKDQVNAAGGLEIGGQRRPVEFVSYDDQSNPANAVRIYEKLITEDNVDLLAAPWSTPIHLAIAPVLAKHKFPMVGNTAASVKLREVKPGYIWFPTAVIPDKVGEELAAFMAKENVKTAAVFANVLPLAQEIKAYLLPALEKNGIKLVANEGLQVKHISPAGIELMKAYAWPGNVRELENLVRRLAALYPQDEITEEIIRTELQASDRPAAPADVGSAADGLPLGQAVENHLQGYFRSFGEALPPVGLYQRVLDEVERPLILAAMTATRGNQIKAAELLGLNRNTLRKKVRELGISVYKAPR